MNVDASFTLFSKCASVADGTNQSRSVTGPTSGVAVSALARAEPAEKMHPTVELHYFRDANGTPPWKLIVAFVRGRHG